MIRIALLFFITQFLLNTSMVTAQAERNLLTNNYTTELLNTRLTDSLLKIHFPRYEQRAVWEAVDPVYRNKMITAGEAELDYKWQTVPATAYLEFVKSGNRKVMEDVYNRNLTALKRLVFAELMEGKGRFIPQMVNGVWAVCEITSWSISASLNLQQKGPGLPDVEEPVIELGAGITCNVMAWTYYLFADTFNKQNPLIAQRIKQEIDRRILQPFYTRDDFWWMALNGKKGLVNNWNIWLNYNVLTCLLLVEDNRAKQVEGIYKTMRSADQFMNYYKDDGGCEEGPAYWSHAGGMLYNYLSLLQDATGNTISLFKEPLIRNIANYICKAFIDSTYFLNYADASAKLTTDAGIVYSFGKATGEPSLTSFGAALAIQQHWQDVLPAETIYGTLRDLSLAKEILNTTPQFPYLEESWMPGTGIAVARDAAGTSDGFYFSALAGHNDESHNHNDVGTCVLFYNGQPLFIDIGSETYTRQTFGPERYSIWTMRSAYHNVPLVNGIEQKEGRQYAAGTTSFINTKRSAVFKVDISHAYPSEAHIKKWERTYTLKRGVSFTIEDDYHLSEENGNTALHFMTSADVTAKAAGILELAIGNNRMQLLYDPAQLEPVIEKITIKDARLLQSWPSAISRLVFRLVNHKPAGKIKILINKVS